jgi:hypothetical protein
MCETSQVCSGRCACSAAATGRPRSAQHTSCRPWVQTRNSGESCAVRPGDRPRPSWSRSRSNREAGSSTVQVSSQGSCTAAKAANTVSSPGLERPCRRIISTRTPARRARAASSVLTSTGSRLSLTASIPQGPGSSTSRNDRTVDAVPACDSPRASLAVEQRKEGLNRRPVAALRGPGAC